jgi:hypothetical protein
MKVPLSKGVNDIQYRFIQKERIQWNSVQNQYI